MLNLIGKTHHLTITFKDIEGKMIGLAGRNIEHSNQSPYGKYMYTAGLARSNTLFNIHNMKPGSEAVLVEGMLDCLHAHAKGIANIVALGGTACNRNQLKQLEALGIKQITLCLDNDHAGREATSKVIEQLSKAGSSITTKVATLPQSIKDPDQMLHEKGVEAFKGVLANAKVIEFKSNYATLAQNMNTLGSSTLNSNVIHDKLNIKEISNEL